MSTSKKLNLHSLLDEALDKAGGVRALARILDWHHGTIAAVKTGDKLSPYRARQLAHFLERGPQEEDDAMYTALAELAKADPERKFWLNRVGGGSETREPLGNGLRHRVNKALSALDTEWKARRVHPTLERQDIEVSQMLEVLLRDYKRKLNAADADKKAG